jgi:iron complex outermembrane receptor protein
MATVSVSEILCVTGATLVMLPGLALAQTSQVSEPTDVVPDIVVTARKTQERIGDVPVSVSATSGEQLKTQGISDAADLTRITPSFTYEQSTSGTPVYSIRGLGFLAAETAASPTVSAYVDQVPLPFSINTKGAILDLDRVEILKGPQGTLFGQNSTGGAVNFIAAKPTNSFASAGEITYARFNEIDAEGYVSGPLGPNLTARIAVRTEQRFDGYQYAYIPGDERTNGQRDFSTGRLTFDWTPSDRLRFELVASGWGDRSDTPAAQYVDYAPTVVPGAPGQAAVLPGFPRAPDNDRAVEWHDGFSLRDNETQWQIALRGDLDLGDNLTLTSITSYLDLDVNLPIDPDGVVYPVITLVTVASDKTVNQELRLANANASQIKWVVGTNYEHDEALETGVFNNFHASNSQPGPFTLYDFSEVNNQTVSTYAAFGNLEYKATETIAAQLAARYTKQNRDFAGCLFDGGDGTTSAFYNYLAYGFSGVPGHIPPGGCATLGTNGQPDGIVRNSLDQDNTSWKAGLSWKVDPESLLYVSATKGFKAGAFDTLPAVRSSQFNPVTQESLLAYEVGAKSSLLNNSVNLEAASFYYDYRNKQIEGYINTGIPFGNLPALISVPKSRLLGAELTATIRPITGARLSLAATYLDSRVSDSFVTSSPVGDSVNIQGESFPNAPRWNFVFDSEYSFGLTRALTGYVGASETYRTESQAAFGDDPRFLIGAYGLLDLRVGIRTFNDTWRLQVFGHNVTDRFYAVNIVREIDTISRTTGLPGVFGIMVSHKFQ